MDSAASLRHARRAAGLSQRLLARRAGVPQSTVSRIESGAMTPGTELLDTLLRACGWSLEILPLAGQGIDRTLIREVLRQSPGDRLRTNDEMVATLASATPVPPVDAR